MRVLVVEDEPDLASVLARSLAENGYAVDLANDGEEGLYRARTWDYDAVVLDIMLPQRDGLSVLRELRKEKTTPVLLLTARDRLDDRVRGLDSGADDYLVKPFELAELLARLRALIRRTAGVAETVLHLGEVVLDTARQSVSRAGEDVHLTAREYSLFEMLALHRGRLVSRTELYEHLFAEDDDSFSNVIDVHISNLRKKLGKELIQTRRGQGYLIEEDSRAGGPNGSTE